jgi:hypothetical protein
VTLAAWECGSHLYGPQKLEVHLYLIGFEYEVAKVARVDQILRARSALPLRQSKCHCERVESQSSLQLLVSCTPY